MEVYTFYILSGYRPASCSFIGSLHSIIHLHNETINIYSHLLGSVLFAILPFLLYKQLSPRYSTANLADIIVFSTFFSGVSICFLLSAIFHILANHSRRIAAFGNQLDYLGVVILMWGSTIPTVYYGFHCDPKIQEIYWTMITVSACAVTTLHSKFRHPRLRPYRAGMYTCLRLSATIFVIHGMMLYGGKTQNFRMSLDWMALMATLNLVGAFTYTARIPERYYPRKYDILGSSHQILHFMVIFAGLAHMFGVLKDFDNIYSHKFHCSRAL
ncbi:hemolysin-III channel Izh2 protein [Rutstroemia sp. NJR-2017a WRK4]|nr:hemolysin-III channel Izh2 protein [Rutstroemia sp. NJR-2017a WRK4]